MTLWKKFRNIDWRNIAKSAAIVGVGASLTYLSEWARGADLGSMQGVVVAIMAWLVNTVKEWNRAEAD